VEIATVTQKWTNLTHRFSQRPHNGIVQCSPLNIQYLESIQSKEANFHTIIRISPNEKKILHCTFIDMYGSINIKTNQT
jgi:hypothetical protein